MSEKRLIEEDLFIKHRIVDPNSNQGKKIHEFLLSRAKALAGKYIDFDKTPVTFVLADKEHPNAFYAPGFHPENRPHRSDFNVPRFLINPYNHPVIAVYSGLIEFADNLDQLDYYLAHELTHMILKQKGIDKNSKGEELISNLHAVDLMYDAGGDPKEALIMEKKCIEYKKHNREYYLQKYYDERDDKEHGIKWSEIIDVHVTDENNLTAVQASLTRLSHLIDDRKPAEFDKSIFDASYSDPVDEYLKAHNYKRQKSLGKLKILIDCIDHLAKPQPTEEFVAQEQANIDREVEFNIYDSSLANRLDVLKTSKKSGYKNYFNGAVINKNYQQKIAELAENIINEVKTHREAKGRKFKPAALNTRDLTQYLINQAYTHLESNGYADPKDLNYMNSAGIMYSYFYCLLTENAGSRRRRRNNDKIPPKRTKPVIEKEITKAIRRIRKAKSFEDFQNAAEDLSRLTHHLNEIKNTSYGRYGDKLDNLTGIKDYSFYHNQNSPAPFKNVKVGQPVPWDHIIKFAEENEESRVYIEKFLDIHGITDHRISTKKPYIRTGYEKCFAVDDKGQVTKKIPQYEFDFEVHKETVLKAYNYIKDYYTSEEDLIKKSCQEAIEINDTDYVENDGVKDKYNRKSMANIKHYSFVSMFNSLPDIFDGDDRYKDKATSLSLIPDRIQKKKPIPGFDENGKSNFSNSLFEFENPIFIKYFGDKLKDKLTKRKTKQQELMFNTAIQVLKNAVDSYLVAAPKIEGLRESRNKYDDERYELSESKFSPFKLLKIAELKLKVSKIDGEIELWREKKDHNEGVIHNFGSSILDKDSYWYHLNRLSADQKKKIAQFIVNDEKGAFIQVFHAEGYEHFCDYLGILNEQFGLIFNNQSKEGGEDFKLTPNMQIVANNYGYEHLRTPEKIKEKVDNTDKNLYSQERRTYEWSLIGFDIINYLATAPEPRINVHAFASTLKMMERDNRNSTMWKSGKVIADGYHGYKEFVRNYDFITLCSDTIDFQDNYDGLSFEELADTADSIAKIKHQFSDVLDLGKSTSSYRRNQDKVPVNPKHKEFIGLLEKNIKELIRKAEHAALAEEDALKKIQDIYILYNQCSTGDGRDARTAYTEDLIENEDRYKNIETLSKEPGFWPDDALEHAKALVFAKNSFLDDKTYENEVINKIIEKVEKLPESKKKNECLHILLDQEMRAAMPETRERLYELYANCLYSKLGEDDKSTKFENRLAIYLKALSDPENDQEKRERIKPWDIGNKSTRDSLLSNTMGAADRNVLLRCVSDKLLSQEQTSKMCKDACQLALDSDDMFRSYLYGIGIDYLTEELDRDPETAKEFLSFLNSKGEHADCKEISSYIEIKCKDKYKDNDKRLKEILRNTKPNQCKILFENFWAAPLDARAVIISRILKSAIKNEDDNQKKAEQSWEKVFDIVMDTVIRPDDDSIEALYAKDILHSYIKSRSDYEREIILSAMMVASRNLGGETGNIGKALKLFLENMGPAEIKLGQAIASHPDTPASIKVELQDLKSAADVPARWTLYDWIKAERIPEKYWKNEYLGKILGSASYYTTVALGEDFVLRILRPEAREKAAKGFKVILMTVDDLQEKDSLNDLDYAELTSAVQEMIKQANKMSHIETDHDIGEQQYNFAKEIYNGMNIQCGGHNFKLKLMDWRARGENWIIMDKADGVTFNALPEITEEARAYKKDFAKGYIVFELKRILSGKKFDHDKHGDQLCIDKNTDNIGIFDTGAMATTDPSIQDQIYLGNVLHKALSEMIATKGSFNSFSKAISEKIDSLHSEGIDTQYLVEVKKGLLALGDYFNVLDEKDIQSILPCINLRQDLSEHVRSGLTENMSLMESAQLKAYEAMQNSQNNIAVIISSHDQDIDDAKVVIETQTPITTSKSGWLQNTIKDASAKKKSNMPTQRQLSNHFEENHISFTAH